MPSRQIRVSVHVTLVAWGWTLGFPVLAADSNAPAATNVAEEVVVTAQRRRENIQDVPISISAIAERQLLDRHVDSLDDIALIAPGLAYTPSGPGQGELVIRGIQVSGNRATEPRFQPAVGVYFDELPVANALYNPGLNAFDVARVEVLRGPQGTLYGSGSLAGTIKFVTNSPDASGIDTAGRLSLSSTDDAPDENYSVDAMLNLPVLSDIAALRLVGGLQQERGYIDNIADGTEGWGAVKTKYGRLAFGVRASDRLDIVVRGIAQRMEANGDGVSDLESPGVEGRLSENEQWRLTPTPVEDNFSSVSAEINFDATSATLTSVTSYLDRDIRNQFSQTNIMPVFIGAPLQYAPYENPLRYHGFLQELRATSATSGPFKWLVGGFYSSSGKRFAQSFPTPGIDEYLASIGLPPSQDFGVSEPNNLWQSLLQFEESQTAAFGELSYGFLEQRLVATVGGRWFKFKQDYHVRAAGLYNGGVTTGAANVDTDDFNPKFVLSFQLSDDVLLAAQVSEGFRLGGANDVVPADVCGAAAPLTFEPEHLRNYEITAKTSWLDKRLIANLGVYEMHYDDIQLTQRFVPECGFSFTGNGGKATSRGVELELSGKVGERFEWSAFGSWVDATLDEDTPPGINGFKGDRLPFAPRFSGTVYGRYAFPLIGDLGAFVQADYRYIGERVQRVDYKLDPVGFDQPVPAYSLTNLQVGVFKETWDLHLYMNNAFDEREVQAGGGYSFGLPEAGRTVLINRPRTVGLEFALRLRP
jgi:iron complex outermembrane recepter protein